MELGDLIKQTRMALGISQEEFANRAGMSKWGYVSISRYERGYVKPSRQVFETLVEVYDIPGKWVSPGVWADPDGVPHNLNIHGRPRKSQVSYDLVSRSNRSEENERRKQVLKHYAQEAEQIYENRTAGDFTWEGLLMSFFDEFA